MSGPNSERTYSETEITNRLAETLTAWHYTDGFIQRTYKTTGWKATLMIVNTVALLCETAWHHPDLEVSYNRVIVKLQNHAANGITDKDFELAAKLDEVIEWQPGGALTGPPASYRILAGE